MCRGLGLRWKLKGGFDRLTKRNSERNTTINQYTQLLQIVTLIVGLLCCCWVCSTAPGQKTTCPKKRQPVQKSLAGRNSCFDICQELGNDKFVVKDDEFR
jgi:hypothetical protein